MPETPPLISSADGFIGADHHDDEVPGNDELIDGSHPPRFDFAVVGVGASAGGLEAYTELLKALPPDTGMAFVFIQHLSPQHESMMAELLSKHTAMAVHQVEDRMVIRPNSVYIIRPGHTMTIADGKLRLGESLLSPGHRRPVDDFFRSLAEEQRERAIGILLSGMGSNGTAGAQAIKAVGGYCIAQDPDTAKYPSMPRSLIESGLADAILQISEMPEAIIRYASHRYAAGAAETITLAARETKALTEMLAVLRTRAHHDFNGYKKPTIIRRVERRMGLNQFDTMNEYARYLRQTPAEVTALCDDLMIHVTGFFRDPDAWTALTDQILRPLVRDRENGSSIRAWVSACSTGEEAYTLAMLLVEASEAAGKNFDIKIFATDTADRSLLHARTGVFPGGIESDLSEERLDRFFDKDDSFYRIKKEMRECVVFAPQNVLQDPPFSRLDICTCRNLLIYLEPDVQRRVLSLLHFGLREGGTLFLGTSETLGSGFESMFQTIDKKWRLFRRVGPTRHGSMDFPIFSSRAKSVTDEPHADGRAFTRASVQQIATRLLLEAHTPAAVVIDRESNIVYFHGNTDRFLDQPRGEPTREIMALAKDNIRGPLRVALQRAAGAKDDVLMRDGLIETPAGRMRIQIHISPLESRGLAEHFLVSFHEQPEPPPIAPAEDQTEKQLTEELARIRDELQSTVEELQTSNEEMKASAEETTSINEELQSANEELETSKEELQSLNEELTTVNAQLHSKVEEVERTGNDLASLLGSTDIAVLFLDTHFRIRRYTPAVTKLFDLIPSDVGRPLNDLARKFNDDQLLIDAQAVLDRLLPIEKEITGETRRWYVRRVLPYRTADNRIDGVVITFVDITDLRRALQAKRELEDRLLWSLQASGMGHWELDCAERRFSCAARGRELFDLDEKQGDSFDVLLAAIHPDDRPPFLRAMERAEDPAGDGIFNIEFRVLHPNGGTTWVESRGAVAFDETPAGRIPLRLRGILVDTTERKLAEGVLREAKRQAEAANDAKDQFLANVSHELRTPLAGILLWSKLLLDDSSSKEQRAEGLQSIIRAAQTQQKLVEDLLDSARISAGKLRLDLRTVDFAALVRNAVDSVRPAARIRGIHLHTDIGADLDGVRLDPDRMEQVVLNLLNNAIKFTPAGERILVSLLRHDDQVTLRITDTGQGIAPDVLPHIFNRFHQAITPSRRANNGLGLGLAICRQIVELHNGAISATSPGIGKGSTVTVTLPLFRRPPKNSPPSPAFTCCSSKTMPPPATP
jgi:two-component system CheB/CheR fusion protein